MKITAEPRSDQLNAEDLISGPRTYTIADVRPGTAEQKYDIALTELEGRVWRPPLTVLRIMLAAWGDKAADWTGQRVTLYRDPSITFGKDQVGGIRISHMTGLPNDQPLEVQLTATRGRRKPHRVEPLKAEPALSDRINKAVAAFESVGVSREQLTARFNKEPHDWTDGDLTMLLDVYKSISEGRTTAVDEFGGQE